VWAALISAALYFVIGDWRELAAGASQILDPENLLLLYACFAGVKVFHEFAHAFACKKFGREGGSGGEVHVMGIMLLVFMPMPYVDASSSWAFRSKWHRIIVGTAGMWVELAIAAVAAIVWANTSGAMLKAVAYNVMFIASVSTILFNANPLLRYDGYYILSDLLEIPNLAQRSRQYLGYLVRKYAWNVRHARSMAHSLGERIWFVVYGLLSMAYRVFIMAAIVLFVADKLFFIGAALAVSAVVAFILTPAVKFMRYLAIDPELDRVRPRAVLTTLGFAVLVLGVAGLVPAPDRVRVEGVAEPAGLSIIFAGEDGFVSGAAASPAYVRPDADILVEAANPQLQTELAMMQADREALVAQKNKAQTLSIAAAQSLRKAIDALDEQITHMRDRLKALKVSAPIKGKWICPDWDRIAGAYFERGKRLGLVAGDDLIIRAVAGQDSGGLILEQVEMRDNSEVRKVSIRVKGRPDLQFTGTIRKVIPAGQEMLPSAALGYDAGGLMPTAGDDSKGLKATERFFEIRIEPQPGDVRLLAGQRVVARIDLPSRPLASQWWRAFLQLIQRRFQA